jgi:hypothetical protein
MAQMQVNVFIANAAGGEGKTLLVLPYEPMASIPRHLQGADWSYFVTTTTDDKVIGAPAATVEASIAEHGYSLVSPTG